MRNFVAKFIYLQLLQIYPSALSVAANTLTLMARFMFALIAPMHLTQLTMPRTLAMLLAIAMVQNSSTAMLLLSLRTLKSKALQWSLSEEQRLRAFAWPKILKKWIAKLMEAALCWKHVSSKSNLENTKETRPASRVSFVIVCSYACSNLLISSTIAVEFLHPSIYLRPFLSSTRKQSFILP